MSYDRKRDIFAALLFLTLGLLAIFVVIPQGVTVPSSVKKAALSPDFWPRIIAIGAIVSSTFLLVENTLLRQPPKTAPEEIEATKEYQLGSLHGSVKTAVLIVALFAFYFSLTTLGVVVASIILICAMMLFFGERNFWLIAVLSIATPVLLYGFFRYVANVPMPLGIFAS
jgi:putative tricarboxylic transport membrane protein